MHLNYWSEKSSPLYLPELVSTDEQGYKAVEYGNMVGVLVEAVKELKRQNEELQERIEALEGP